MFSASSELPLAASDGRATVLPVETSPIAGSCASLLPLAVAVDSESPPIASTEAVARASLDVVRSLHQLATVAGSDQVPFEANNQNSFFSVRNSADFSKSTTFSSTTCNMRIDEMTLQAVITLN